jgi:hypothetical protein
MRCARPAGCSAAACRHAATQRRSLPTSTYPAHSQQRQAVSDGQIHRYRESRSQSGSGHGVKYETASHEQKEEAALRGHDREELTPRGVPLFARRGSKPKRQQLMVLRPDTRVIHGVVSAHAEASGDEQHPRMAGCAWRDTRGARGRRGHERLLLPPVPHAMRPCHAAMPCGHGAAAHVPCPARRG